MATSKRVVSVSVKRGKRDRAQKIKTILNESTIASVASGEATEARLAVQPRRPYSTGMPEYDESDRDYVDNNMEAAVALLDRANDRTVTDGIGVIRLDPALLDMLRDQVAVVRKVYPDIWDSPEWGDNPDPWNGIENMDLVHSVLGDHNGYLYAIAFIAGAAAMMDLTPRMLVDNLRL